MNLTEKIFEEYAYQLKRTDCKSIPDHDVIWCGDCYACANCGKRFIPAIVANEVLLSSLKQVATEAIEAVRLDKREEGQVSFEMQDSLLEKYKEGYNSAISKIEQKAKKFLDENFSEKKD